MSQEKEEHNYFELLPNELILNIGNQLPNMESRNAFTLTCQRFYHGYQPERLFPVLLKNVTESNLGKVKLILEQYPTLLLRYGTIADPTGRVFKRITAFQYALWAMDLKDMCRLILDSIPKDKTGNELRYSLLCQLQEIEEQGIAYEKAGIKYNEHSFNWLPLKEMLSVYIRSWPDWNVDEIKKYWCETIGKEQKDFPISIRHFYCGHREVVLDRLIIKRTLLLHDYTNKSEIKWDKDLDGLGVRFAIRQSRKRGAWVTADLATAKNDLLRINLFDECNKKELERIKKELQETMMAHTQSDDSSPAPSYAMRP
ncbi:hypothetical protein [uncultured Legionella sp.]|uniref:hypothetical protein n=1 Tax=uncultured Legionella sp. TaxID=210934 RepID=UPI00263829C8|nr:hypothetical protein [uncultured Legionella sp.]